MKLNLSIRNSNLHHAYCILGNAVDVVNELEKFFQKELKFSVKNNPDFWRGGFDVLKIKDARAIIDSHQNRPTAGDKKIFVVSANFITEEAQNSMLKLFEEPRGDTHLFLILPSLNNIIPTFRSRLFVIDANTAESSIVDANDFLKMPIGKRMEAVKKLCGSISDEEESKIEVIKFINSLEATLHADLRGLGTDKLGKKIKINCEMFEEIEKVRQYAGEQSPSLKMLLEHLSLLIPVFID